MKQDLAAVPEDRRCGAKTRAGTPCKRWAAHGRTRCKLHGGASYRGIAHPNYQHGYYSVDPLERMRWSMIRAHEERQLRIAARLTAAGFVQDDDGQWRRTKSHTP